MAVGCPNGAIENIEVDEIIISSKSCFINRVIVKGDIVAVDSEDLMILNSEVGGRVRLLAGRNAILVGVKALGHITARNNEYANLTLNGARSIRVINNRKAIVKRNVALGVVQCRGNRRLDAFENEGAEINCRALGGGLGGPGPF
jgi:hypothetical protein